MALTLHNDLAANSGRFDSGLRGKLVKIGRGWGLIFSAVKHRTGRRTHLT